jgi:hypothetical protein
MAEEKGFVEKAKELIAKREARGANNPNLVGFSLFSTTEAKAEREELATIPEVVARTAAVKAAQDAKAAQVKESAPHIAANRESRTVIKKSMAQTIASELTGKAWQGERVKTFEDAQARYEERKQSPN